MRRQPSRWIPERGNILPPRRAPDAAVPNRVSREGIGSREPLPSARARVRRSAQVLNEMWTVTALDTTSTAP